MKFGNWTADNWIAGSLIVVRAILVIGILVADRSVDVGSHIYCNYIAYRIINGEEQYVLTNSIFKAYSL